MPTLHWIGKDKVINHHRDVPFRILDHKYTFPVGTHGRASLPESTGNKIIHGDNLEALKSLLPEYEGKIKCIAIDPPYNTGNENWIYNDNVNDPKIKKWLHEVVGKEGEDLSRHDKWLCMMYPRLQLLNKLLSDDGAIFISIDDNEEPNLKLLMDEIFGNNNRLGTIIWKRRTSSQLAQKNLSTDHEYILAYGKTENTKFKGLTKTKDGYSNPNNDPRGPWRLDNLTVGMTKEQRPNQHYNLIDPETGNVFKPNSHRVWAFIPESMAKMISEGRIFFPKDKTKRPMQIRYFNELKSDLNPFSTLLNDNPRKIGLNSEGTKYIQEIFGERTFDYPKPVSLISELISQISDSDSIILDSFAGSGTTAHAVLNLNKEDGGNRKFILIEMENYAETITAERVKRVITGYGDVEGTGGEFDYYELGEPIFIDNGLNPKVPIDKIREYIFFMETKSKLPEENKKDTPYLLGLENNTVYYLYYEIGKETALDYDFLKTIKTKAENYVIYADNCLIPQDFLNSKNIIFKKIPREIPRI